MIVLGRIVVSKIVNFKSFTQRGQFPKNFRNMSGGSMVTFDSKNGKGACEGSFQGQDKNTKKGLIVLQEWWGLNDQIKLVSRDIGNIGNFMTLTPDLYRGKVATDHETAGHLMHDLDWSGAIQDIQGAAIFLIKQGCTKVGVTGFCMGGALSLAAAVKIEEISASAPFYGIPDAKFFSVENIKIPVQAHFGAEDALEGFSSPKDAFALLDKMKGKENFELIMYGGCGHAFTNKSGPLGNYKQEACDRALQRMAEFINKNLQ